MNLMLQCGRCQTRRIEKAYLNVGSESIKMRKRLRRIRRREKGELARDKNRKKMLALKSKIDAPYV
jgi:hypothetical protein